MRCDGSVHACCEQLLAYFLSCDPPLPWDPAEYVRSASGPGVSQEQQGMGAEHKCEEGWTHFWLIKLADARLLGWHSWCSIYKCLPDTSGLQMLPRHIGFTNAYQRHRVYKCLPETPGLQMLTRDVGFTNAYLTHWVYKCLPSKKRTEFPNKQQKRPVCGEMQIQPYGFYLIKSGVVPIPLCQSHTHDVSSSQLQTYCLDGHTNRFGTLSASPPFVRGNSEIFYHSLPHNDNCALSCNYAGT